MSMVAYDVAYRLKGNTGTSSAAVVILDDSNFTDLQAAIKQELALERMCKESDIVDVYPVRLPVNTIVHIRR